jgi:DNA-binding SARP family transcriptional activator
MASACRLCHTEAQWHRRAHALVSERECELVGELVNLLQIAKGHLDNPGGTDAPTRTALPISPSRSLVSCRLPGVRERLQGQRVQTARHELERARGTVASPAANQTRDPGESDSAGTSLGIYCLGPFRVYQNGVLLGEWNSLKGLAVLKYLVAHQGRKVSRETLMDVFWPEADADAARRNLHQAIYSLRKSLREHDGDFPYILSHDNCYKFNPALALWVDAGEFEAHLLHARRHESAGRLDEAMQEYGVAESLYQGRFMEEDPYADWAESKRQYLEQAYLEVASHLSSLFFDRGALTATVTLCQKILAVDPCYENAHRQLMQCYLAQGQRYLAVRQFHLCDAVLRTKSGLKPSEETTALYRRIARST